MIKQNVEGLYSKPAVKGDYVSAYDVVWFSPSTCSRDSMPTGDGENGLNVWAEAENGIYILIGRTDTPAHVKSARLHITTEPNIFGGAFRMETQLYDGFIHITADGCVFNIIADASSDKIGAIHILIETPKTLKVNASYELWRGHTVEEKSSELTSLANSDCVLGFAEGVAWLSHALKEGCEGEFAVGGELAGDGFDKTTPVSLQGSVCGKAVISAFMFSGDCTATGEWYEKLSENKTDYRSADLAQHLEVHKKWWHDFWGRSSIELSNTSDSYSITQRYILQRYIFACSSRGLLPPLYNGSIFRSELEKGADSAFGWLTKEKTTADERPWGSSYMGQNIRQLYWGLLASGDFDLFEPLIRLIRSYIPYGTKEAWETMGHGGFFIPEQFSDHGFTYSANELVAMPSDKRLCRKDESWEARFWHLQHHFIPTLEFTSMFVQLYLYTQNEKLLSDVVIPCVSGCLRFYREHYPEKDANGKMKIFPASTAETYGKARSGYHDFKQCEDVLNPATEVSGLHYIVESCNKISDKLPLELNTLIKEYIEILPELPTKSYDGISLLSPGEQYSPGLLCESAELYPIFPFKNIGLSSSYEARARAVRSYFLRRTSIDGSSDIQYWETGGWHPAGLDAAALGLSYEASRIMEINYSDSLPVISTINNAEYEYRPDHPRFPGFWNYPHMDGIPDQCHGGVSMNILESMLLAWDDQGKIYLLPAWTGERDVSFTLRAPQNTIVSCVFKCGRVISLEVTPQSRACDVINCMSINAQIKSLVEFKACSVNEHFGLAGARDGSLNADDTIYRPILKPFILKYGEALCATRPWNFQNDTLHTFYKGSRLYAVVFGDESRLTLECPRPIAVREIGGEPIDFDYANGKVSINISGCSHEYELSVIRLDFGADIAYERTEGIEYTVRASSEYGVGAAANINPHTDRFWQPESGDKQPSLELSFKEPVNISRAELKLMLPYDGYGIRHDFTVSKVSGGEKTKLFESAVFGRFWEQSICCCDAEKLVFDFAPETEFGISEIRVF